MINRRQFITGAGAALTGALSAPPPLWGIRDGSLADTGPTTISVDTTRTAGPLPHYWEKCAGSDRTVVGLREQWRQDLIRVQRETGIQSIRCHGLFDDEMGIAFGGPGNFNFLYLDQIYDFMLDHGVRPFVELSFMPAKLAAHDIRQSFWYRPIVSPPANYKRWDALIAALARHLIERYGIDEVSQWYFEVWNEPNLDFWAGEPKQSTYFTLYEHTARALKAVDARLRVGGPATAQAAWVAAFQIGRAHV